MTFCEYVWFFTLLRSLEELLDVGTCAVIENETRHIVLASLRARHASTSQFSVELIPTTVSSVCPRSLECCTHSCMRELALVSMPLPFWQF